MTKKLTPKQLAKWLDSLPETTPVWALACHVDTTAQQSTALLARHDANRQVVGKLTEELNALDSLLTASAESDAGENMPAELNDAEMLGYAPNYLNHLIGAAAVHWETAGRDLNAEIGRNIY
jgi:hypothetical protein